MPPRRDVRTRWAVASLVTLAVHGVIFFGLSQTPKGGRAPEPPLIEVTLTRLEPPPEREPKPVEPHRLPPMQLHQPPTVTPDAPPSGFTPGPPGPPAPPGPRAAPTPEPPAAASAKLKLDCLHLGPAARKSVYGSEDCEVQRYAKIGGGDGGYNVAANPAWDAQVADRMRKHEGLRPDPPFKNACENSNLGLGCTGDMLIPLAKKKF